MTRNINKVAAMAAAMVMLAGPAIAGDIKIKWKMAGTLIQGVELADPSLPGETVTAVLLHLKAVGSPGPADIWALAQTSNPQFGGCVAPVGLGLLLDFDFDDVVITFNDLSQIYLGLDTGTVCVDLGTGASVGEIDFDITGGSGRYEGATGDLFLSTVVVPLSGSLSSVINEEATGTIHTP